MCENKNLDEKKLEQVTGGELMDAATKVGPSRVRGGCFDCVYSDRTECPFPPTRLFGSRK